MVLKNLHTGQPEPVDVGDILYSYFEQGGHGTKERQLTWSFRCQGLLSTSDADYILGPGNVMYELGLDCFTNDNEARDVGYYHKTLRKRKIPRKYKLVMMEDEEKVRM